MSREGFSMLWSKADEKDAMPGKRTHEVAGSPEKMPHPALRKLAGLCVSLVVTLLLSGCGYHLARRGPALPDSIQTVHVAPWSNRSNEFLLGSWITDELRQTFLRESGLKIASREEADVILEGEILQVTTSGLSYITYDRAVERRITAECAVRMIDQKTGELLWETNNIVRWESFLVGSDVVATEGLKNEALRKLSQDVADLVYHRVTGVY